MLQIQNCIGRTELKADLNYDQAVIVLFDGPDPLLITQILGVTAIAFLGMRAFWNLALRNYSSASS